MNVILLDNVENLGSIGDMVKVKPGYARNYLLPQKKALRASEQNIAYFEARKKSLQAESDKKKKEAAAASPEPHYHQRVRYMSLLCDGESVIVCSGSVVAITEERKSRWKSI